jgi:hypothetical protein
MSQFEVDPFQSVRIVGGHEKRIARLETLGTPSAGSVHHTLIAFQPAVAVGCFGRFRLLPGSGKRYRVIAWAIALDKAGSAVVDILQGAGYPPPTSMCPAARPNTFGASHKNGTTAGWARTTIAHGDWMILNIFSFSLAAQLGFSLELKVEDA